MGDKTVFFLVACLTIFATSEIRVGAWGPLSLDPNNACPWCVRSSSCNCTDEDPDTHFCECLDGYQGDGSFSCHKPEKWDVCTLCDDPTVTIYSGGSARAYYPAIAKFSDDIFDKDLSSSIRIRTVISNYRNRGKMYPRCVLVIVDSVSSTHCQDYFKIFGWYRPETKSLDFEVNIGEWNGVDLTLHSPETFSTAGDVGKRHVVVSCGCVYLFHFDKGHTFKMEILGCLHWEMGFRPFISDLPDLKSGIFVAAPKRNKTTSLPEDLTSLGICLHPGLTFEQVRDRLGLSERIDAVSAIAMSNLDSTLLSDLSPAMSNLTDTLRTCSFVELKNFFDNARELVSTHPFINCISDDANGDDSFEDILMLLENAVKFMCQGDLTACSAVKSVITTRCPLLLSTPGKYSQIKALAAQLCVV